MRHRIGDLGRLNVRRQWQLHDHSMHAIVHV